MYCEGNESAKRHKPTFCCFFFFFFFFLFSQFSQNLIPLMNSINPKYAADKN